MKSFSVTTYAALRKKVHEVLLLGQQEIEEAKVRTYWETGRLINEYLRRSENPNQEHGKKVVIKLAGDLGFGETILYRCMRFSEQFPTLAARPKLSWAHYRTLIAVPHEKKRYALAEEAAKAEWSSRELGIEVRNFLWDERAKAVDGKPPELLPVPVLGPFYTYQVAQLESIHPEVPSRVLDVGFSSKKDMSLFPSCRLPAGTVVASTKGARGNYSLCEVPRAKGQDPRDSVSSVARGSWNVELLYTYKAYVKKVIDGDTLKVELDIGFGDWHGETLRLKGIDCPEINTPEGKAAKRFVERELGACEFITVKSTQTRKEKWGRYLGDVFLEKRLQSAVSSPQSNLIYLNNLLLEKGMAVRVRY